LCAICAGRTVVRLLISLISAVHSKSPVDGKSEVRLVPRDRKDVFLGRLAGRSVPTNKHGDHQIAAEELEEDDVSLVGRSSHCVHARGTLPVSSPLFQDVSRPSSPFVLSFLHLLVVVVLSHPSCEGLPCRLGSDVSLRRMASDGCRRIPLRPPFHAVRHVKDWRSACPFRSVGFVFQPRLVRRTCTRMPSIPPRLSFASLRSNRRTGRRRTWRAARQEATYLRVGSPALAGPSRSSLVSPSWLRVCVCAFPMASAGISFLFCPFFVLAHGRTVVHVRLHVSFFGGVWIVGKGPYDGSRAFPLVLLVFFPLVQA